MLLGKGCFSRAVVLHELMHAIGFVHEQSRPDRNNYVRVLWQNVEAGRESEFERYGGEYFTENGFPYDLKSVMHYTEHSFSKNGRPTLIARSKVALRCRGRKCPTQSDVDRINHLYKCSFRGDLKLSEQHGDQRLPFFVSSRFSRFKHFTDFKDQPSTGAQHTSRKTPDSERQLSLFVAPPIQSPYWPIACPNCHLFYSNANFYPLNQLHFAPVNPVEYHKVALFQDAYGNLLLSGVAAGR